MTKVIAFDGYWLGNGPPSGRNILDSLIHFWATQYPEDKLIVFVPNKSHSKIELDVHRNIQFIFRPHRTRFHAFWVLLEMLPKNLEFDMSITQNFTPLSRRSSKSKQVTFVHDVIYRRHPEWFSAIERLYLGLIRITVPFSDMVATSSHTESIRIEEEFPFLRGRIVSVGLDVPYSLTNEHSDRKINPLTDFKKYILCVGRLNVRKNLQLIIDAYKLSNLNNEFDLVIVGEPNGKNGKFYQGDAGVHWLGYVSDAELRMLYSNSSLFVCASHDEGFGLPLIEANYFQVPTLASKIEVFQELGTASGYFDPASVEQLSQMMRHTLSNFLRPKQAFFGNWFSVIQKLRKLS
jgi:glycosyltransferase involved in cell wall biosynthesis